MRKIIDRIGETSIANNGLQMKIIAYRNNNDIDIQFEDGTIVTHKKYYRFKKGCIQHPNISYRFKDRTGEISIAFNGMQMKIINYRHSNNIDIQFEDGTIVYNKQYSNFKEGLIKHPNINNKLKDRTGETSIASNGMQMKIIKYRNCEDIDIQFEDGNVIFHRSYKSFKNGSIVFLIREKIGETSIAKNGMQMKIIACRNIEDIDIEFEDGTIVYNKQYSNFKSGTIKHPNISANFKDRTGETSIASNGMQMKIITYKNANDIDIEFEDGTIVYNRTYGSFKKKSIKNPKYKKCKHVSTFHNEKIYLCTCRKCNQKHVLKLSEMKDFECTMANTTY